MFDKLKTLFDVTRSSNTTSLGFPLVVWAFVAGSVIALLVIYYNRKVTGAFIRALIAAEAFSPDSAKTPSELLQTGNSSALRKYRSSYSFRKLVSVTAPAGEDGCLTIDENTRFYIPEESFPRAKALYGNDGGNIWVLLGSIVGIFLLGVVICAIYVII